jgi:hypothetical protein
MSEKGLKMIRFGMLAAALVLAGCGGAGSDVTAKLAAQCKADGGGTDQECQCMSEKLVAAAGPELIGKMLAASEAQGSGGTVPEPTMEEAMKLMGATATAAQACNIQL